MPTKIRFQAFQVSTAAQGSFTQKVLLRLGKPESVLWHHLRISMGGLATPGLRNTGSCGRAVAELRMVWNAIIDPPVPGDSAQAAHRHCTRPFPGESGLATRSLAS